MKPTKPILNYPGGKWILADWIIPFFPTSTVASVYVEPFGGAGSVLAKKNRHDIEVWNDIDQDLYNLFSVIRNKSQKRELLYALRYTLWSRQESQVSFILCDDPVERARRFIVRNMQTIGQGHQGKSFRTTKARGSNPANRMLSYARELVKFIDRFRGVIIENEDAISCIERYDSSETIFYVDPPYVKSTRRKKKLYSYEIDEDYHIELANRLRSVEGFVYISGYNSGLYQNLYKGWHLESISSQTNGGKSKNEILWMNPKASSYQLRLF